DSQPAALQESLRAFELIEAFQTRTAILFAEPIGAEAVPAAFVAPMEDDLNVPTALAVLHDTVRSGNSALNAQDTEAVRLYLGQVNTMVEVLGLNAADEAHSRTTTAA